MCVADNIYRIIKEKNFKQSAIAIAAGYNRKTFNDLLRGRKMITANDIIPICNALGVMPNDLFSTDSEDAEEKSAS